MEAYGLSVCLLLFDSMRASPSHLLSYSWSLALNVVLNIHTNTHTSLCCLHTQVCTSQMQLQAMGMGNQRSSAPSQTGAPVHWQKVARFKSMPHRNPKELVEMLELNQLRELQHKQQEQQQGMQQQPNGACAERLLSLYLLP